MFSFLLAEVQNDFRHYFDWGTFEGQLLIMTLAFLGLLLIGGLIYFASKKFSLAMIGMLFVYALVMIVICTVKSVQKSQQSADKYGLDLTYMVLIAVFVAVIAVLMLVSSVIFRKSAFFQTPKRQRILQYSLLGISIASGAGAIILLALSLFANKKDEAILLEYMTRQSQVFLATAVFLLLIAFVALVLMRKSSDVAGLSEKTLKIISLSAAGVVAASAVVLFIVAAARGGLKIFSTSEQNVLLLSVSLFLVLVSVILFLIMTGKKQEGNETLAIVYAAVCIAFSFALSYVRVFKLPQGGSITLASLVPIAVYSYMFGVRRGVLCCFIYGLLQSLQDPWIIHPIQYFLDYPIAFSMIGFAGIFKKLKPNLGIVLGILFAVTLRYVSHAFAGALFFGTYGADYGINNAWAWGFIYNTFTFADGAICMVVGALLFSSKQMLKQMKSVENRFRMKGQTPAAEPAAGSGPDEV